MADAQPIRVEPPLEALRYFRNKGMAPSFSWQDVWQEEHGRAFTVAKAMNRDVLETIRAEVDAAIANGTTLAAFRNDLTPRLQALGWWGHKEMTDPLTGEIKTALLGSPSRLRTIFEVNTRTAYQAGRWERIERQKALFPYLRYVAVKDGRTRPQHIAWHNTVRPVDDAWWNTHYPPCGWGCRCTAIAYNARQLARQGLGVTEKPEAFPTREWRNKRTGEITDIETGIDPGWDYHVGKTKLAGLAPSPAAPRRDVDTPPASGGKRPNRANGAAEVKAFFEPFGMAVADVRKGRTFTDKGGWPLAMSMDWFRSNGETVVPTGDVAGAGRTIVAPEEIRWVWGRALNGAAVLVRRYLTLGADARVVRAVDIGRDGWMVDHGGINLDTLRTGKLAWAATRQPSTGATDSAAFFASLDRGQPVGSGLISTGDIAPGTMREITRLGLSLRSPAVWLEHGRARHALRHAADRQPVGLDDLRSVRRLLEKGAISKGKGLTREGNAKIVVESGGTTAIFEVRRRGLVLLTMWKGKVSPP